MYAAHFGLSHEPFSIAPDPRYLFMSERHREALAHLLFGLDAGGGVVLLSGDIGTGKTTVVRCFLEQVPERVHVAYIFNPKLSVQELLGTVCDEFGVAVQAAGPVPTVKECVDPLNAFLLAGHAAGRNSVLVIDEAQNLSTEVLEQLRLLTNLETRERKLLQIILVGQPELRELLARPELEQLAQRVVARYHLGALDAVETGQYIAHRLAVAGLKGPNPFDARAIRRIHQLSGGVPRRINLLCGRALLGAYGQGAARITRAIVDRAAHEVFDRPARSRGWDGRGPWRLAAAALGGGAVVLMATLGWWALQPAAGPSGVAAAAPASSGAASMRSPGEASARASAAPASASLTAASAAARTDPPEVLPLPALLPLLAADERSAWRQLEGAGFASSAAADPCIGRTDGRRCHRGSQLGWTLVRQLDRPGLIPLQPAGAAAPAWAVLTAIDATHATVLTPQGPRRLAVLELASAWRGEFATLWTPPPGFDEGVKDGAPGALAEWMARSLSLALGAAMPAGPVRWDGAWRQRLEAFQRAQGLRADGVPGPLTLMQLGRLAGLPDPRLNPSAGTR